MTVAEMRQGALDANWGPRKCDVLEAYRVRNQGLRKVAGSLDMCGLTPNSGVTH